MRRIQTFHRARPTVADEAVKVLGLSGDPQWKPPPFRLASRKERSDRSRWAYGGAGLFLRRKFHRDKTSNCTHAAFRKRSHHLQNYGGPSRATRRDQRAQRQSAFLGLGSERTPEEFSDGVTYAVAQEWVIEVNGDTLKISRTGFVVGSS